MRQIAEPKVYLVGRTILDKMGMSEFLHDIGDPAWDPDPGATGPETLLEMAGRLCYRSWQPYDPEKPEATNPNVTKVTKGNRAYLKNIIKSGHGSVLEHVTVTFILRGVSRVFTHELVRHRAGMGYSQESMRYVVLYDLPFWIPSSIRENEKASELFSVALAACERTQLELANLFELSSQPFAEKKKLTSLFRRLVPMGVGTTIMVSGNLRAWRHIISMRTSEHAEEEARLVMGKIAKVLQSLYPNVFQDMTEDQINGEFFFSYEKV